MSSNSTKFTIPPLLKHRLVILIGGVTGAALAQAAGLGFIPTGIASAAGALIGEILSFEQSQP